MIPGTKVATLREQLVKADEDAKHGYPVVDLRHNFAVYPDPHLPEVYYLIVRGECLGGSMSHALKTKKSVSICCNDFPKMGVFIGHLGSSQLKFS